MYANENLWMPQKRIAELFDVDRGVIIKHLKNILSDNELLKDSVCAKFAHTATPSLTKLYKLHELYKLYKLKFHAPRPWEQKRIHRDPL